MCYSLNITSVFKAQTYKYEFVACQNLVVYVVLYCYIMCHNCYQTTWATHSSFKHLGLACTNMMFIYYATG